MLKSTKRIYFVRCVRNHYEFEWFLLSCELSIEWLWTKVHCTWRLLEDIMITWPTNWRRYRKHSFRLSSLVFRCCCKNRSDDGWRGMHCESLWYLHRQHWLSITTQSKTERRRKNAEPSLFRPASLRSINGLVAATMRIAVVAWHQPVAVFRHSHSSRSAHQTGNPDHSILSKHDRLAAPALLTLSSWVFM
jgi:hypothetical protein